MCALRKLRQIYQPVPIRVEVAELAHDVVDVLRLDQEADISEHRTHLFAVKNAVAIRVVAVKNLAGSGAPPLRNTTTAFS